jgi:histidyl-tRNA synthetase
MKPSLPQGTRDFSAETVRKRQYILNTIKSVFELYGFQPLETPAMENLETLMGKYGEEGDQLIFKILNNGLNNPEKEKQLRSDFEHVLGGKNNKGITERALRYDLTIPFARYVAMNHGQLSFPFKRYQMQPVWRADRPQRGRYREFYQCDCDVVGSNSLLNEVELIHIYTTVFTKLGIDVLIKINNRKILAALAELCGGAENMMAITVAIDKLDKIGLDKVKAELSAKGISDAAINNIEQYLQINGDNITKLQAIKHLLGNTTIANKGIVELEDVLNFYTETAATRTTNVEIDFTLARGLNYYTGTILEIKANGINIGSIGGGGRYDDLTGLFGVPNIPGVGISFGVDRIYDVLEELKLFPASLNSSTKILFFNTGEAEKKNAFTLMQTLRAKGINCELFHEEQKFDKQFKYAEKKNIPFIVIIGSKEVETNTCTIKELATGKQEIIEQSKLFVYPGLQ